MTTETILSILAILGLLVCSGFFSGSETAMTGASRPRMHALEQQGSRAAMIVNQMWQRKERLIGAILLGNNLVNIAASAIATSLAITLLGENGVFAATVVMTLLVLIFSEVLPKTYAIHHADKMAVFVAPILRVVRRHLRPGEPGDHLVVRGTSSWSTSISARRSARSRARRSCAARSTCTPAAVRRSPPGAPDAALDPRPGRRRGLEIMTHRKNVVTVNADLPIGE